MSNETPEAQFRDFADTLAMSLISLVENDSPLPDDITLEAVREVAVKLIRLEITGQPADDFAVDNVINDCISHAHRVLYQVDIYTTLTAAAPRKLDKATVKDLFQSRSDVYSNTRSLLGALRATLVAYTEAAERAAEDGQD